MTEASISEHDVLCGRGGATNTHIGNKRFRAIVAEYQDVYLRARKKEKAQIALRVVERIRQNGGRFLKRDSASDMWVAVPSKKALGKTGQALREGLDVRHKTIRPDKMPRKYSDAKSNSPRVRARLVEGKVAMSPALSSVATEQTIPSLEEERAFDGVSLYFAPQQITQENVEVFEQV
eukprot:CAMPEP_0113612558 /NCGR_PEP_ID=MMETSP0017_2-20120614/6165_1 /TAXON_ID=2856 /ORGANISM="Cylindrotheca closterium" /LENGTH=177 /DNA_ID=CAMNT_0000521603 /DNA_START=108 /DNA_END=641 /DNA_ORIENTATION=+ /assembly_acc=CAM_ASM_000147